MWALKFTSEIKDHTHHYCLYSCPVLQYITKAYLVCAIALTDWNPYLNFKYKNCWKPPSSSEIILTNISFRVLSVLSLKWQMVNRKTL